MADNIVSLMLKTAPFLLLRAVVIIALLLPFIPVAYLGMQCAVLYVSDIWVFKIAYAYVTCAAWFVYMQGIQKYVLYMLNAAQMYAVASYLTGESERVTAITGIAGSIRKAGSIHVMFALNCAIDSVLRKELMPKIKAYDFLKEFGKTWYGQYAYKCMESVIEHIDEAILCYSFANDDIGLVKGTAEGLAFYLKNWKDVGMRSIRAVLSLSIIKAIFKLMTLYFGVQVWWNYGYQYLTGYLIAVIFLYYVLKVTLAEPYLSLLLLKNYIVYAVDENMNDTGIEEAVETIIDSASWKTAFSAASGGIGALIMECVLGGFDIEPDREETIENDNTGENESGFAEELSSELSNRSNSVSDTTVDGSESGNSIDDSNQAASVN